MNRQQIENRYKFFQLMSSEYGMERNEVDALFRDETVLHTWAEHECNGAIQRDEVTNKPFWFNTNTGKKISPTSDRERGAEKRVLAIIKAVNARNTEENQLAVGFHGDPRGGMIILTDAETQHHIYLPD